MGRFLNICRRCSLAADDTEMNPMSLENVPQLKLFKDGTRKKAKGKLSLCWCCLVMFVCLQACKMMPIKLFLYCKLIRKMLHKGETFVVGCEK
jgi:hypothetical protein